MEKNSSIILTEVEKSQVRGGVLPERFVGWYTLEELEEHL